MLAARASPMPMPRLPLSISALSAGTGLAVLLTSWLVPVPAHAQGWSAPSPRTPRSQVAEGLALWGAASFVHQQVGLEGRVLRADVQDRSNVDRSQWTSALPASTIGASSLRISGVGFEVGVDLSRHLYAAAHLGGGIGAVPEYALVQGEWLVTPRGVRSLSVVTAVVVGLRVPLGTLESIGAGPVAVRGELLAGYQSLTLSQWATSTRTAARVPAEAHFGAPIAMPRIHLEATLARDLAVGIFAGISVLEHRDRMAGLSLTLRDAR
jgi:hypothetical protein